MTTQEIENLTQFFMNYKTFAEVQVELNLLENLKPETNTSISRAELNAAVYSKEADKIMDIMRKDTQLLISLEERQQLFIKATHYRQRAHAELISAATDVVAAIRPAVDKLNMEAYLIEKVITEEVGPWDISTFEKIN